MKILDALILAQNKLKQSNVENPSIDALILLMHITSFSKEKIVFNPDLELTKNNLDSFLTLVARRQLREPVSHIIGRREFYGLEFFINAHVLDPRSDSESLIELIAEIFFNKEQKLTILELGTGSGCLSITLLKNFTQSEVSAVDISLKALEVAKRNSALHQVCDRFKLIHSDLFKNIEPKKFDIIISNPPYIATKEIEFLSDDVRLFEPRLALDGGFDGLDFYRKISNESSAFLAPHGLVIIEIGYGQKQNIVDIFAQNKFYLKNEKKDLSGIDRVLVFELLRN